MGRILGLLNKDLEESLEDTFLLLPFFTSVDGLLIHSSFPLLYFHMTQLMYLGCTFSNISFCEDLAFKSDLYFEQASILL